MVYGKRVGAILTVCTDNQCPVHDPRAAARAAEHPAPIMAPAPAVETDEQAEERRQQYEAQQKAHAEEQQRRDEERQKQEEREEQEREAEFARRDKLRKQREETFERIVAQAPAMLTAAQLRVLLRAIVNLDPYTFADDLAEDTANENDKRSAEEVLLAAIDNTADDKLTGFAVRLALSGHRAIPREGEPDFLTEAAAAFLTRRPKKSAAKKAVPARKEPTPIKPAKTATKKALAKKDTAQPVENAVAA